MRLRRGFTEYGVEISSLSDLPDAEPNTQSKKNSMSAYRFVQVRHSVWLSSGGANGITTCSLRGNPIFGRPSVWPRGGRGELII